ncbi:MAG: phytoene/squalene synthetase [Psychroserpens sp.]|jgi:phytoene/squalene synthetase|uniref:phytoene/squalene synthase family protein n=1 Tax=Psychroserpens sp. TaxID=2020870 RepID=UPI0039E5BA82
MKSIFDTVSHECSKTVTKSYSTSFSLATKMLSDSIRQDIYNIYGFVRFADEIVDSFHDYDKHVLFENFSNDLELALEQKISLNPILNSFQETYHKYNVDKHLVDAFMKSMRTDLHKSTYLTNEEYKQYIYGSADVVGLMCLKVFVKGDNEKYDSLKDSAMSLGSAFQKVNFLRDLKADFEDLSRTYFPNTDLNHLDEASKQAIIEDIEHDFAAGLQGIKRLPIEAKFGVYMAYRYYSQLLKKLKKTPAIEIKSTRIRVPNYKKFELLTRSYVKYQLNLIQ